VKNQSLFAKAGPEGLSDSVNFLVSLSGFCAQWTGFSGFPVGAQRLDQKPKLAHESFAASFFFPIDLKSRLGLANVRGKFGPYCARKLRQVYF